MQMHVKDVYQLQLLIIWLAKEIYPQCNHQVKYGDNLYPCNLLIGEGHYDEERYNEKLEKNNTVINIVKKFQINKTITSNSAKLCDLYQNNRPCPNCGMMISKDGGCFRMTCSRCSHSFWWPTGQSWHEYTQEMQNYKGEQIDWWNNANNWVKYWADWTIINPIIQRKK